MLSKAKQVGIFLFPAIVLAVGALVGFPMQQQAFACGSSSCDGGGSNGGKCCGSLVNVQDNKVGNVKTGDVHVGHVDASNNKIKFLNNNDVLSNNDIKIKDINVLSKNYNKLLNNNKIKVANVGDVLSDNPIKIKVLNDNLNIKKSFNILSNNYKEACGC